MIGELWGMLLLGEEDRTRGECVVCGWSSEPGEFPAVEEGLAEHLTAHDGWPGVVAVRRLSRGTALQPAGPGVYTTVDGRFAIRRDTVVRIDAGRAHYVWLVTDVTDTAARRLKAFLTLSEAVRWLDARAAAPAAALNDRPVP